VSNEIVSHLQHPHDLSDGWLRMAFSGLLRRPGQSVTSIAAIRDDAAWDTRSSRRRPGLAVVGGAVRSRWSLEWVLGHVLVAWAGATPPRPDSEPLGAAIGRWRSSLRTAWSQPTYVTQPGTRPRRAVTPSGLTPLVPPTRHRTVNGAISSGHRVVTGCFATRRPQESKPPSFTGPGRQHPDNWMRWPTGSRE
jgi:hypothetical protein